MNIKIEDFLPKYPNIFNNEKDDDLNPYPNFYESVYNKKEFHDQKLEKNEALPDKKGFLMLNQVFISRFLSSRTPYDQILLFHEMGSGKTCTVIGAIEQIRKEGGFKGAYIFGKGKLILNNFIKELRDSCTAGLYLPDSDRKYTRIEYLNATKKLYENFYNITFNKHATTFETFARQIEKYTSEEIRVRFSNHILVIDEVHNFSSAELKDSKRKEKKDSDSDSENFSDEDIEERSKLDIYGVFHRFLHAVENCKIILMTGTPMKDSSHEIGKIMNLILPMNKQMPNTESDFSDFSASPSFEADIKKFFKGRVSFLKSMKSDQVVKKFVGETLVGLQQLKLQSVVMSEFQTASYVNSLKQVDNNLYSDSRQASLFVFPDGSFGTPGFNKYLQAGGRQSVSGKKKKTSYGITQKFQEELNLNEFGNSDAQKLEKLEKFSKKFAFVIREILKENKKCFIYCQHVTQSGLILFSELLKKYFNFYQAKGQETTKAKRFAIFTNETSSNSQIRNILDIFNSKQNVNGEFIQVILGSDVISEGLSFSDIQKEFILSPWFNYSTIEQSIARGVRLGSHAFLLENQATVELQIFQMVSLPLIQPPELKNSLGSVELYMYQLCENKDIKIKSVIRFMMESAVDCLLNYKRNISTDTTLDNSRECEYQKCEYVCEEQDFEFEEDYTTFSYYTDSIQNDIEKKIDTYLNKNGDTSLDELIKKFKTDDTTQNTIRSYVENAIVDGTVSLEKYNAFYGNTVIKKLILKIESLFQKSFKYSFEMICSELKDYRQFDILTALKKIIDENIILRNKYGFFSFLREIDNVFIIVDNIKDTIDFFSDYYSENPYIRENTSFQTVFEKIQNTYLPVFINKIKDIKDQGIFDDAMKYIPKDIQEFFVENAILLKEDSKMNKDIFTFLMEYFKSYIKNFPFNGKDTVISFIQEGDNVYRCFSDNAWKDCLEEEIQGYKTLTKNTKNILDSDNNFYRYYGKFNSETQTFVIVDLDAQKQSIEKKKNKTLKQPKKDANVNSNLFSGKSCTSFKKEELIRMVVKFDIEYPTKVNKDVDELLKDENLQKIFNEYFDGIELTQKQKENAYKYIYSKATSKFICPLIKTFFEKTVYNGVNLLVYEKDIGKQGYTKIDSSAKNESKISVNIYSKTEINKEFIKKDVDKFQLDSEKDDDNMKYICILKNKKLKAVLKILSDTIVNIFILDSAKKDAKKLIKKGVDNFEEKNSVTLNIKIHSDEDIAKYTEFGFEKSGENTMTLK